MRKYQQTGQRLAKSRPGHFSLFAIIISAADRDTLNLRARLAWAGVVRG